MADNYPPVLLIENLYTQKNTWKLARRIYRMLVSVGVEKRDIISIVVEESKGRARVYLRDQEAQEFAIKVFSDVRDVMNFFDVRKVTAYPSRVKVGRVSGDNRPGRDASPVNAPHTIMAESTTSQPVSKGSPTRVSTIPEEERLSVASTAAETTTQRVAAANAVRGETTSSTTTTSVAMQHDFLRLDEDEDTISSGSKPPPKIMLNVSTSVSGLPPQKKPSNEGEGSSSPGNDESKGGKAAMVDAKTSTPQVSPCFCPDTVFYHRNQLVGTEARHVEFKQGRIVFNMRDFRFTLGRYLCAFMNTEGGKIYFGVTDEGRTVGINIHQDDEDRIRLDIDYVVSRTIPMITPSEYSVNFAKVMDGKGHILPGLYVLEISVHSRVATTQYSYDGFVYDRRNASIRKSWY